MGRDGGDRSVRGVVVIGIVGVVRSGLGLFCVRIRRERTNGR
jgi:hypothetical protein